MRIRDKRKEEGRIYLFTRTLLSLLHYPHSYTILTPPTLFSPCGSSFAPGPRTGRARNSIPSKALAVPRRGTISIFECAA